ncbi:Sodium/calcium exchanger protein-domain-containing protein [Parachaetomium inaequale]|uniref:Vacuolar calcium ion transporter n=1 Tax=Parachaetomium inaequale TaxID=2588326 RepID=A0AAN6SUL2_9PEZI|nr:Sodium/calcium exchanger protein-domain-containing protein [Parachaetomium inaequale]
MENGLDSSHLTRPTVNLKTRDQIRRETGKFPSPPNGNGGSSAHFSSLDEMDGERRPLLGHQTASNLHAEPGFWRHLLVNNQSSPGTDSPNPFVRWPARVWNVTKITLFSSWINLLLVFVPLGIVAGEREWGAPWVFTLNFLAIIPLAAVLSFATEEIAGRLGETLGGLVNATFGNAVELIVSIVALRAGEIEVVQASMLGSILSNLLLVLGMCFFLGGVYNMRGPDGHGTEQSFSTATAQTTCSLMTLASASMILPAALYGVLSKADEDNKQASILVLSRGTAIILLFLYVLYLYFALRTHKKLFEPEAQANGSGEEEHEPLLGPWSAGLVLVVVTLIISVCADYMVDSIDALVATGKISKTFIGLILIPIVGNAAEHVTACVVAVKDKMDLAMGVAIGSSIQIALLVTPALVMLGWAIGQPMTLHFETFETIAFALSVLVVTYTVQDGKSNYLEGAMLLGLYMIIALAFWASPTDALGKV